MIMCTYIYIYMYIYIFRHRHIIYNIHMKLYIYIYIHNIGDCHRDLGIPFFTNWCCLQAVDIAGKFDDPKAAAREITGLAGIELAFRHCDGLAFAGRQLLTFGGDDCDRD